ncbi:unnamed protein product [Urochloa decumbens]|uniref:CCHC-type domain-containing protein n=1 Tax=Urochloa decumbens TaxID=240449 RepID=A0ABC8WF76_9POAL
MGATYPRQNPVPRAQGDARRNYNPEESAREAQETLKNKAKKGISEGTSKAAEPIKCFRCTELGHHQLDCTNDPVCYKCKKSEHMAIDCAQSQSRKIKMFGFGVHGQGFYAIEIPDKKKDEKFGALIVVQDGVASEERIAKELQHLIKADWDFEVKKLEKDEYRASFPDQGSIDTYSKLTGIKLPLFGLTVQIINSNIDPAATAVLQTAWVKVYGIPSYAKEEDIVKEITSLVGEPIKVDEFSLVRDEPVRVRINCRDPAKVRGAVEIFFNGVGHEIRFISKGFHLKNQGKGDGPPGTGNNNDKNEKG